MGIVCNIGILGVVFTLNGFDIHLAGISESIYRKMSRNEAVRMDVLERVCAALRVDVGDVCSFIRSR